MNTVTVVFPLYEYKYVLLEGKDINRERHHIRRCVLIVHLLTFTTIQYIVAYLTVIRSAR